ncbi:MAG: Tn3 family transposase [Chloroflexi bacterium]|nr:Tn3 family transposase [Chloroflexota bacterium]
MKRLWTIPELIDHWTLTETERALVDASHDPHTRLGCACLLKFFQLDWRFPRRPAEVSAPAVAHLAQQLSLPATVFLRYDWAGRMATHHRTAIRAFLGVREATVADQQAVTDWLAASVLPQTQQAEALRAAFIDRCRILGLEPPTPNRVERHLRTALATFHEQVCAAVLRRLPADIQAKLEALLIVEPTPDGPVPDASGRSALADLKAEAGPFGVETVRQEAAKLDRIRQLGLSPDILAGISPKLLDGFRQRVVAEELHELRRHPTARRLTLLAAYCQRRAQELTDTLAEILIDAIQHIEVRAERRVERALLRDLTRVTGKQTLLFEIAEASLERPDERVRDVIYPIAGEDRLRELVKEYKASGPAYKRKVYTVMRASYSAHYRRLVPIILRTLEFRSNNDRHRPVIEALALLKRYVEAPSTQPYFTLGDDVPLDGVVRPAWRDLVVTREDDGQERVNRINYEIAVLHTLRDKLRCKEVWVVGADRYRNPDDDLPADFAANRAGYYAALDLPTEADAFIAGLKQQLTAALTALDADLPTNPSVRLLTKGGGWIALTPADPQPEPVNLDRLKGELGRRWPMTGLLDMLKEADLRVGFTDLFATATVREHLDRPTLQKRLLLCVYGLGTNIGLRRVAAGDHGQSERDLYYTRRRFITRDALRAAIGRVVNAVFAARRPEIWGEATTACASDSKKFGAFDQNLLTEWHVRYRGPGVMIYWHMDKKAACIFSQLKRCSSSEVAAMITGVIRHCTDMAIDRQFVDSHGQSEVAFTFCNLLGFRLLPRLKALHAQKLYRPEVGQLDAYPHLQPVLTRPIRWELIGQQYDEMIKYVTALRTGTAEAEAILRRFSRANVQHPTYAAMAELGKVYKTLFLCDYLRLPELRREIHEGLNVVENWNSANGFIFYGRGGEFATNQREDAEVAMLCLHLLQLCLVYINTLMIQQVLAEPDWRERLTGEDLRALTPLVYANVNPYGLIRLDMDRRLPLEDEAA